jgi:replicative DNA helicase
MEEGINAIECPAAEQLEDAIAHAKQLIFILSIHAMRLRSAEWERQRKAAQRAHKHEIERDASERQLRSA